MTEDLLNSLSIFASLPDEEISYLVEALPQRSCKPGTLLMQEGQPANSFLILLEGEVEIIKALGTKDERQLAIRNVGSFIGEMGLLSEARLHTSSVRARSNIKLLTMTETEFDGLLHRQPAMAYEMIRRLSRRLDESENLTIRDLRQKNRELIEAYQELEAAQAALIEKERMERELEVARGIQISILPQWIPDRSGYIFGALMSPMRAVGGDFYDFIPLGDNRVGIAIGDVSDHGVPAAMFMALAATLMRAEARRGISPRTALLEVNNQLLEMNASGMFVTMIYGVLDLETREFTYTRAGHEIPIVIETDGNIIEQPRAVGQLMGILDEPTLEEQTLILPPGATMLLFTDGVTEAADSQERMFGKDRLMKTLVDCRHLTGQDFCAEILDRVSRHIGSDIPQDDITVVVAQSRETW